MHMGSYVTAVKVRFRVHVLRDLCPRPHPLKLTCNVCKRVKFMILNVSLHYVCKNGHGCRNKCTRKRVLRTCMVCVVPVRMRPLMSFPHTTSNNAHDKISKSKKNPGIVSADNHTMRNNFVDFFF